MYGILVLCFGKKTKSHVTRVQLWRSVLSYVWDICLMYGVFVLCMGYLSYVWGISLMYGILVLCFGINQNHVLPRCNYGGVYYCLMFGIFV